MRKFWSVAALLIGASLAGCATTAYDHEQLAQRHDMRAQRAASYGDYQTAAREQRRAERERREAARLRYQNGPDYRYDNQRAYRNVPPPPPAAPPPPVNTFPY